MPNYMFGFIDGEDGKEYLFTANSLKGTDIRLLLAGLPVTFDVDSLQPTRASVVQPVR